MLHLEQVMLMADTRRKAIDKGLAFPRIEWLQLRYLAQAPALGSKPR